jgi:hypothetical protein
MNDSLLTKWIWKLESQEGLLILDA